MLSLLIYQRCLFRSRYSIHSQSVIDYLKIRFVHLSSSSSCANTDWEQTELRFSLSSFPFAWFFHQGYNSRRHCQIFHWHRYVMSVSELFCAFPMHYMIYSDLETKEGSHWFPSGIRLGLESWILPFSSSSSFLDRNLLDFGLIYSFSLLSSNKALTSFTEWIIQLTNTCLFMCEQKITGQIRCGGRW